ncbi:receptor like protein 1 [Artemisia annua]|uniref:Receptor like protein 1 n=1 Tax=Artemisia annua TaxID=35608 RepID=A0A2U1N0N5_ARTAN|nr:receptor like protein 1 [Artemisia annua]
MKHKSWLSWLLIMTMTTIFLVRRAQGVCADDERKTLLEIKASLMNSYDSAVDNVLPTWVDHGECCNWERVQCNTTTGRVTMILLGNLNDDTRYIADPEVYWPLNVSLFSHFKELRSLNLSWNYLDHELLNTGLVRLSSLKKLEILDLSSNFAIDNDILPSLTTLTSLRVLNLAFTSLEGHFPTNEFAALENLEMLDLTDCHFSGTMSGLLHLNLDWNIFRNDTLKFLVAFPSLEFLSLGHSHLNRSALVQEVPNMRNLEVLLLGNNNLRGKLAMKALASFPNLKILDLSSNNLIGSIPSEISSLSSLRVLYLAENNLYGSLPEYGKLHKALCYILFLKII